MNRTLRRLAFPFIRDDLFHRVVWFVFGVLLVGAGSGLLYAAFAPDSPGSSAPCSTPMSHAALAEVMCLFGLPLLIAGAVAMARCGVSANSLLARAFNDQLPDTGDVEGFLLGLVVVYLPAVLLTLTLRAFGVRGQRVPRVSKSPDVARSAVGRPQPPY